MELWDNDQIILFIMFDFIKVLKLNRNLVKLGMNKFEEGRANGRNYIKLDGVITYNAKGEFHTWYWEKEKK